MKPDETSEADSSPTIDMPQLSIDLMRAPPPEREFFANALGVFDQGEYVAMGFGQQLGDTLLAAVNVFTSKATLGAIASSFAEDFLPRLHSQTKIKPKERRNELSISDITSLPPKQHTTLYANAVYTACATDATIDFYHIPGRFVHESARENVKSLDSLRAVIRINCSRELLIRAVQSLLSRNDALKD